ncbi:MAG: DUF1189 family protein [Tenericutes bacterium]|nr:DUF1189 family protein [Mycoplasmatota bacterium]
MFNIFRDSLFNPKGLVKYANKNGFLVFLYFLILTLLMSAGTIISIVSFENSSMTEETTGCHIVDESFVCDGDEYDVDNLFFLYGFRVYFLPEDVPVSSIANFDNQSIVFQDNSLSIHLNGSEFYNFNYISLYELDGIEDAMSTLSTFFLIGGIAGAIIQNIFLMLVIIFISSLAFLKFRKEIKYKKIFKLIVFAVTPLTLLFMFYSLLNFSDIIFFILMFLAYRSIFALQKELFYQKVLRDHKSNQVNDNNEDIIESYKFEDIDQEDVDQEDDKDSKDDELD